jgi:hypothetical protein
VRRGKGRLDLEGARTGCNGQNGKGNREGWAFSQNNKLSKQSKADGQLFQRAEVKGWLASIWT